MGGVYAARTCDKSRMRRTYFFLPYCLDEGLPRQACWVREEAKQCIRFGRMRITTNSQVKAGGSSPKKTVHQKIEGKVTQTGRVVVYPSIYCMYKLKGPVGSEGTKRIGRSIYHPSADQPQPA